MMWRVVVACVLQGAEFARGRSRSPAASSRLSTLSLEK
jgi:hypothetical protein